MGIFEVWILLLFIGSSLLVNFKTAITRLGMIETEQEFQKFPSYYRFLIWMRKAAPTLHWEQFIDFVGINIQVYRLFFTLFAAFDFFLILGLTPTFFNLWVVSLSVLAVVVLLELGMRLLAILFPLYSLKFIGLLAGMMMLVFFPIIYPVVLIQQLFTNKQEIKSQTLQSLKFKTKLQEFIHALDFNQTISIQEKKLLLAVASFRDRIAREIMVPRVDVYRISTKKTIAECAKEFIQEGYSRIPVYDENVDNIIGVILSKDILDYLTKSSTDPAHFPKDKSIKPLVKPVLFTPETKKISNLLQEFKSSQIHLAIVVDEYGGTEGIVTIEDILEELVGEIEDEFDVEQAKLFQPDQNGGFTLDAKTSLIDLENQTGIVIPQAPTYDTVGGFIVNIAGSIPKKGWKVHYDRFYIEILSGDDKSIEKIRIVPTFPAN